MAQVLLVDDEAEILNLLKNRLLLDGISVETALSAEEAIEKNKDNLFPVVLTDIRMPGKSGVELIREIRKNQPTAIVYIMTGYASLSSMVECIGAGAVDYFMKPFDQVDEVAHTIKEAVQRHERWMSDLKGLKKGKAA